MVIATRLCHGTCANPPICRVPRAVGGAFETTVGRRSPLRRLALTAAGLAAIVVAGAAVVWVSSPDPSDIQARVKALTQARGIPLLGESDVPPLLVDAVVAAEDERFFSHHGIDSIGFGPALPHRFTKPCLWAGGSTITG